MRGYVVMADLDPVEGHEQGGYRPCVVVSHPDAVSHQRFPLIIVVPLSSSPTAAKLTGPLYPIIEPAPRIGLSKRSAALTDQIRTIDKSRVRRVAAAPLDPAVMAAIDDALRFLLGLTPPAPVTLPRADA
jgi:mRNA interferase MazF